MQIQATSEPAVPSPASTANNTSAASAVPPANVTVTVTVVASPVPQAQNNTTDINPIRTPGLPPAVFITHTPAYGSDDKLKGMVKGVDPAKYRLAIFINTYGWWNAPSSTQPLTAINSDGSWESDITVGGLGEIATEIDAFLVPADFNAPIVSGRYGLPPELKTGAIACNAVSRTPPS